MNIKYIIAIVQSRALSQLERNLRDIGVGGISFEKGTRFGDWGELMSGDWRDDYTKLEIYAEESKAQSVVEAITSTSRALHASGGVVAVIPVENFIAVRGR